MLQEILGLDRREYEATTAAVFAYLFHRIDMKRLAQVINDKKKMKHIAQVVKKDGYVLLNCKLYAYAHWVAAKEGRKIKAKDFGVDPKDARLLKRLNLGHIKSKYPAMSVKEFKGYIEDAVYGPDMEVYMGKFVSKKMAFLMKSYGQDRESLNATMQAAAIKGLYKQFPLFESPLHLRNLAKTLIKNEGKTMISFFTRKSRNAMLEELDEHGRHQAALVSLEVAADLAAEATPLESMRDTITTLVSLAPKLGPRAQRFVLLLAGQPDEEFSEFLERDNSDAIEEMSYSRYMKKVQTFLGVSDEQTQSLFEWLRPRLA